MRSMAIDHHPHAQPRERTANTKPVGPAPTTRTSVSLIDDALII